MDIKICGITNLPDARAAVDAGADFLGFVLYSRSPRGISGAALRRIAGKLDGACKLVGVFVNERPEHVAQIAEDCCLCAVQLHGNESFGDFSGLSLLVWRALRVRDDGAPDPAPEHWPAARYVVDAWSPHAYGGTGELVDWEQAAVLAKRFPVMLAGGLTPDNVEEAVKAVRPAGVDVAGGVEKAPGRKDHVKLKAFAAAARQAESQLQSDHRTG